MTDEIDYEALLSRGAAALADARAVAEATQNIVENTKLLLRYGRRRPRLRDPDK